MYMYHSFLIHLSADGHLGCFRVLAVVNSAAVNIGVHMSLSILVSSVPFTQASLNSLALPSPVLQSIGLVGRIMT